MHRGSLLDRVCSDCVPAGDSFLRLRLLLKWNGKSVLLYVDVPALPLLLEILAMEHDGLERIPQGQDQSSVWHAVDLQARTAEVCPVC